jgi:hypothetical protein
VFAPPAWSWRARLMNSSTTSSGISCWSVMSRKIVRHPSAKTPEARHLEVCSERVALSADQKDGRCHIGNPGLPRRVNALENPSHDGDGAPLYADGPCHGETQIANANTVSVRVGSSLRNEAVH